MMICCAVLGFGAARANSVAAGGVFDSDGLAEHPTTMSESMPPQATVERCFIVPPFISL